MKKIECDSSSFCLFVDVQYNYIYAAPGKCAILSVAVTWKKLLPKSHKKKTKTDLTHFDMTWTKTNIYKSMGYKVSYVYRVFNI